MSDLAKTGLGYLLRRAHRLFAKTLAKRLAEHGIPLAQFQILRVLWSRDGLTQTELSDSIEVERAALTGIFTELERSGLVRRKRDPSDGRRMLVFLTKRGRSLHDPLMHVALSINDIAVDGLAPADVKRATSIVETLVRNLQRLE